MISLLDFIGCPETSKQMTLDDSDLMTYGVQRSQLPFWSRCWCSGVPYIYKRIRQCLPCPQWNSIASYRSVSLSQHTMMASTAWIPPRKHPKINEVATHLTTLYSQSPVNTRPFVHSSTWQLHFEDHWYPPSYHWEFHLLASPVSIVGAHSQKKNSEVVNHFRIFTAYVSMFICMLMSFSTYFQVLLLLLNFFLAHGGIHQVFLFQLHDLGMG